jgi:hypothetical protein
MKCNIGDLVWIPESSRLLWAQKDDGVIRKVTFTKDPKVALVVSEFNEQSYCILIDGEYWLIDNTEIYEVPNVSHT